MKEELNIAAILKDKPKGTKLWSPISGDCKYEYLVHNSIDVWFQGFGITMLSKKGKWSQYGETIIFPSKQMQDWSKFAWKKGDVLSNTSGFSVLFVDWITADYTRFKCKSVSDLSMEGYYDTKDFISVPDEEAQKAIKNLEESYGGKLNLETLEIEKQQEFKDGDILYMCGCRLIYIFKNRIEQSTATFYYVGISNDSLYYNSTIDDVLGSRPATEEEKQQLFSALSKEGKRWNPDTKTIEDLPKKCEFKAFDKVLVRDTPDDDWMPAFFAEYSDDGYGDISYGVCGGNTCVYYDNCIPYNEETAHLLGTTDEWK